VHMFIKVGKGSCGMEVGKNVDSQPGFNALDDVASVVCVGGPGPYLR
jgi:hypothetical protein